MQASRSALGNGIQYTDSHRLVSTEFYRKLPEFRGGPDAGWADLRRLDVSRSRSNRFDSPTGDKTGGRVHGLFRPAVFLLASGVSRVRGSS